MKFKFFFLVIFSLFLGQVLGQNQYETKLYIQDKIESSEPERYTSKLYFGNGFEKNNLNNFTCYDINRSIQNRLIVVENILYDENRTRRGVFYRIFDPKGISSISFREVSSGLNEFIINIKDGYNCCLKIGRNKANKKDHISIPLWMTQEDMNKLKNAFYRLCKLYEGRPLDKDMF